MRPVAGSISRPPTTAFRVLGFRPAYVTSSANRSSPLSSISTTSSVPPAPITVGTEEVVEIELSDEEKSNLKVSTDAVEELLEACKGLDSSLA